jgi:uncharacterized protein (TIGR02588 family)
MKKSNQSQRRDIPIGQRIFAAIGAVFVLASIATLLYSVSTSHSVSTSRDSGPILSVRVGSIKRVARQFLVIVEVRNEGGSTAADTLIEAVLQQDGSVIERSGVILDFVPPKSCQQAGVLFERDPEKAN